MKTLKKKKYLGLNNSLYHRLGSFHVVVWWYGGGGGS